MNTATAARAKKPTGKAGNTHSAPVPQAQMAPVTEVTQRAPQKSPRSISNMLKSIGSPRAGLEEIRAVSRKSLYHAAQLRT